MTTTDLSQFGNRELGIAGEILTAYSENNLTELALSFFNTDGVTVMMNQNSGNVFLTNSDYEVLMLRGDELDLFLTTPYDGREGFIDELMEEFDDMHQEDKEYVSMFDAEIA